MRGPPTTTTTTLPATHNSGQSAELLRNKRLCTVAANYYLLGRLSLAAGASWWALRLETRNLARDESDLSFSLSSSWMCSISHQASSLPALLRASFLKALFTNKARNQRPSCVLTRQTRVALTGRVVTFDIATSWTICEEAALVCL